MSQMVTPDHFLKIDPDPFDAVLTGKKRFEIRYNDRGYQVGDMVALAKTTYPASLMKDDPENFPLEFSGHVIFASITYLINGGYGLEDGWSVFSISVEKAATFDPDYLLGFFK